MAESQGTSQVVEYVEGAKQQAQVIGRKVEDYLRSTKKFQAACDDAFNKVDGRGVGKLSLDQCADACVIFFKDISSSVDDFGIKVSEPSRTEVKQILMDSGYRDGDMLNRAEFEELYAAILKYAAIKCAYGFTKKYGLGMIVGYAAVHGIKHIIYKLPKGKDAKKKLRWVPSIIVGPLLGVLGVWGSERGDLGSIKRKLFPDTPKGQFKTG